MTRTFATPSLALALALFAGCSSPSDKATPRELDNAPATPACNEHGPPPTPVRSPGGTAELAPAEVRANACKLRIIDVREADELDDPLGVIAGAEHVPARRLAVEALSWDRDEPLLLVCRSGRRSGQATRELETLGFSRVASMTGGMLAWQAAGFATVSGARATATQPPAASTPAQPRELSVADIEAHVGDRDRVRWTKAATLMLHGTQACVDGRDAHAIIGTPGGDAGELVLTLASAERLRGRSFTTAEVGALFDAYLDAFGHFYLHTDDHAVAALLAAVEAEQPNADAAAAWLRSPPPAARARLLDALVEPAHVGCGHLRLMLAHSEAYGVRRELVADVIQAFYRRLWAEHPALEFVVLVGEHAESAVVEVELAHEVHAYTRIPLISPRLAATEVFVLHPQVAHFIRQQNASFLRTHHSWDVEVGPQRLLAELEQLAARQLEATVAHLAADLPRFRVRFANGGASFEVTRVAPPGGSTFR